MKKTLKELEDGPTDREKVNKWLDHIGELDESIRNHVLEQCSKDIEARRYYVKRFNIDCQ